MVDARDMVPKPGMGTMPQVAIYLVVVAGVVLLMESAWSLAFVSLASALALAFFSVALASALAFLA